MNIRAFTGAALLVFFLSSTCSFAQGTEAPLDTAKRYCGQVIEIGKEAVNQGEQKKTKEAVGSLKKMRNDLNTVYSKVERGALFSSNAALKEKGKEAIKRLETVDEKIVAAIRHGEAGRHEEMMKAAREVAAQAEEVCRLVSAM